MDPTRRRFEAARRGTVVVGEAVRAAPTGSGPVVSVVALHKRFGGTEALRGVDLTVQAGEIHAFLGANGAGKSTLIKILAGVHAADEGHITIRGSALSEAIELKRLSFVHQDLGLVDAMSIGENMAMAYGYPTRRGLIDWRAVEAAAALALERLGWPLPLNQMVGELSQAEKSIVAIARALTRDIDVLILDEPTASLPEMDVGRLFDALRTIRARNIGIVYVTHRLDEVFRLADAVTVLRDGRVVASYTDLAELSPEQLVRDICGKLPARARAASFTTSGAPALSVTDLCVGPIGPVSFEVGATEIVGLAGLRGQGHARIGRAVAGIDLATSGAIRVGRKQASYRDPKGAIEAGVGFTSGKRADESLATDHERAGEPVLQPVQFRPSQSVAAVPQCGTAGRRGRPRKLRRSPARPRSRCVHTQRRKPAEGRAGALGRARVPNPGPRRADHRRGYRRQIRDLPDVGGRRRKGTPCLVVSSDLDELVQVCNRVLAFSAGRIVAEVDRDEMTVETLTHAISGGSLSQMTS